MDDADRRALIRHCVREVLEPQIAVAFSHFLEQQQEQLVYAATYYIQFGFPIALPPSIFDVRPAAERLEDALVVALKDHE